jgi:hypothetical protein
MEIIPITFRKACEFVVEHHRHHKPPRGQKFAIGCQCGDKLIGVAIAGRPVARRLDNGLTLEITRVCTDGTKNACSKLYGAVARIAKHMGYKKVITYILESEPGSSLKASGFVYELTTSGKSWSVQSRPRKDKHPLGPKQKWSKDF